MRGGTSGKNCRNRMFPEVTKMSCKHYQKLLHLNRPGEISPNQRRKLQRHLTRCATCSQEKTKIKKADDDIAAIREIKPELSDPGLLSAGILRSIRGTRFSPRKNRFPRRIPKNPADFFQRARDHKKAPTSKESPSGSK